MDSPVKFWAERDFLEGRAARSFAVVLRTGGCRWRRCTMCGYWQEGNAPQPQPPSPPSPEALVRQLEFAVRKLGGRCAEPPEVLKIYTSGSFFDDAEVPEAARLRILEAAAELGVRKVVVESRPEFVTPERVRACVERFANLEVAIGLETSDDFIREKFINKGFGFEDFLRAAEVVRGEGASLRTYLLMKPPFLSERAALEDVVRSARAVAFSDVISLNLCNVQRNTPLERLWRERCYRPPWLWSAVEALKRIKRFYKGVLISDPVGAGSQRGPHNCGRCDRKVSAAIRRFSVTQNDDALAELTCDCVERWLKILELEELVFGITAD
ncbi:MAG: archaeosine biosynthesis radical SAM protein RaSEA [Candidatus Alkanophagales archaeon]